VYVCIYICVYMYIYVCVCVTQTYVCTVWLKCNKVQSVQQMHRPRRLNQLQQAD
jgi:hypothetical protein